MLEVATRTSDHRSPDSTAERGTGSAAVADALLAQPELGIRRITYVGLPEREAVHLALAARRRGLRPTLAHGAAATASVAVQAHESPPAPISISPPGPWLRLWARARRILSRF